MKIYSEDIMAFVVALLVIFGLYSNHTFSDEPIKEQPNLITIKDVECIVYNESITCNWEKYNYEKKIQRANDAIKKLMDERKKKDKV